MSLFMIAPPNTVGTDAWIVRAEVDPSDWAEATPATRLEFIDWLTARYVDSQGNSPYDLMQVMAGGRVVQTVELFHPPRRSGPEGADRNVPSYARGRR